MKGKRKPPSLTSSTVFRAFDEIESAQIDIQGTLDLLTILLDARGFDMKGSESLPHSLERYLTADYAALKAAIDKSRKALMQATDNDRGVDDAA